MKKSPLLIFLIFSLTAKSQDIGSLQAQQATINQQYNNAVNNMVSLLTTANNTLSILQANTNTLSTINIGLNQKVADQKKSIDSLNAIIVKLIGIPVQPAIDYTKLNSVEDTYFTNIIYANGSLGYDHPTFTIKKTLAINGEEVGLLKTMKGSWNVPYRGNGCCAIANNVGGNNRIPSLIDNIYLEFSGNKPATYYEQSGNAIPKKIAPPFEMWLVSRYMPGQRYEARLAGGGNCSLLGDSEYSIRAVNPQYGFVPNSVMPEIYKTHIERLVVKDLTQADYWIDGAYVGTIKFQYPDLNNYTKSDEVIGVVSNNALWDFAAQYYAERNFTDTEAATVFGSLKTRFNTQTYPNEILLNNITFTKNGTNYVPSATILYKPAGVTVLDPSQWDYIWYTDDGSLQKQVVWSTKYQPPLSDWNSTMGGRIKVTIRPKDNTGHVWRYLEGTYAAH